MSDDTTEYEDHEIALLNLTDEQKRDFNKVLHALSGRPVVRLGAGENLKELLFSERVRISTALVPVLAEVREDERRRQSSNDSGVEPQELQQGSEGNGPTGVTDGTDKPS